MKAKGAQQARAQGMPHTETRMVAMRRERTKGARHIEPANIKWLHCQAVRRSGLFLWRYAMNGGRLAGGRGVKFLAGPSVGDWTTQGRRIEAMKVMMEKTTREREPTRPTSPRASLLVLAGEAGW